MLFYVYYAMPDLLRFTNATRTKETLLLNPLLTLFQTKKPCIALASLVLSANKRANDRIVRYLGEARLVCLYLVWETVEFGPVDL